jgi:hypothetical protein
MWLDMNKCEPIEIGTIVNGKMTYTLPKPPPNCFEGGSENWFKETISQPTTLQIAIAGKFLRDSHYSTSYNSKPVYSQDRLVRSVIALIPIYFSEAGTISGSNGGGTIEITAKAGWNWIAWYEQQDEQETFEVNSFTSDLSKLPSDMRWITAVEE